MYMLITLISFGHPSSEFVEEYKKHGVDNTNTSLSCNDWKQEKQNNIRNTLDGTLLVIPMDSVGAQTPPGGDEPTDNIGPVGVVDELTSYEQFVLDNILI